MFGPSSKIKTLITIEEVWAIREYWIKSVCSKVITIIIDRNALHNLDRKQDVSSSTLFVWRWRIRANSRDFTAISQAYQPREILTIWTTTPSRKWIWLVLLHLWAISTNTVEVLRMQRILREAISQVEVHIIPWISTCADIGLLILISWQLLAEFGDCSYKQFEWNNTCV